MVATNRSIGILNLGTRLIPRRPRIIALPSTSFISSFHHSPLLSSPAAHPNASSPSPDSTLPPSSPSSSTPTPTRNLITLPKPISPEFKSPSSYNPNPISQSKVLSLLKSQPSHYIIALLLGRRYILTPSDVLTVRRMKDVSVGDVIRLTRVLELGSRDFTLRAKGPDDDGAGAGTTKKSSSNDDDDETSPILNTSPKKSQLFSRDWQRFPNSLGKGLSPSIVQVDCTIIEHTKEKMETVEKFRKRKRYHRSLKRKTGFTKILVGDIVIQPKIEEGEEEVV